MSILEAIKKAVLDIIFPITCLGCSQEGSWLCPACLGKIKLNKRTNCPVCRQANSLQTCPGCQEKTCLDGLLTAAHYDQQILQDAVHAFKYGCLTAMAEPLGLILENFLVNIDKKYLPPMLADHINTILAPVPLHKKRLSERGFNQSELLAEYINKTLKIKYYPHLLKRSRYTTAQAQLKKKERENNLLGAFAINRPFNFSGKNVIIVDDIATTLSTLNECAKILKQAGCSKVWGLVIARGG